MNRLLTKLSAAVFLFLSLLSVTASADLVLAVEYTGIVGGALDGGMVRVETVIESGSTWHQDFLGNPDVQEHDGLVIVEVSGTASVDGTYLYEGTMAGFNVNTDGDGTLFSIADSPLSNTVNVTDGTNTLSFFYQFSLPNDDGIVFGQQILQEQLPNVASGLAFLQLNGSGSTVGNVEMIGAIQAIPEPSGLLWIGAVCGTLLSFRRRD